MTDLIDAGVNLTNHQFEGEHQAVIARANAAGVKAMLLIGCDIPSSQQSLELATRFDQYSTAGVHPHDAKDATEQLESTLTELAQNSAVVAIGECGLDYNRDFSPRDIQRSVLRRQLALAEKLNLPVYLHERDASDDMLSILKEFKVRGVLHCFTGNKQALKNYLNLGLYIGITGWVCDERRGKELQALVPSIPLERLLIETDAPFLIPRTITPKPKSRKNEPANLSYVCATLAKLYNVDENLVAKHSTENFYSLFDIAGR
ncbi:TatD DNase family protein [Pseudoalteromonas espejiana DSM 9414]|uniref:Preprotein translocase subunit TatD n=1 Tax=Pseudoalteromonas espejiana TaxID=28107 RepID=A0A510XTS0_9GAMM|nr:TatD family hydrolase [Pseudoalteromonas espejiana]ASM51523.1 TatD DNase family protein [Pseudoalteromonas espejiana DSM 9414]GEK54424.1 preprotein translocase subunit TatD [Pseudoalteromonas espejiana]